MNFSFLQWCILIALDFIIRACWFFMTSFNLPLVLVVAPELSLAHLTVLAATSFCVNQLKLRPSVRVGLTLTIENALFIGTFLFLRISRIIEHRATACGADQCEWIDGVITPAGRESLMRGSIEQVVVNLVPVLAILAFARYGARARK